MAVYQMQPTGGNGLGNALQLWSQFLGPQAKQNRANLAATQASTANTQAQLPGVQAQSQEAQLRAASDNQTQNALSDVMGLNTGSANSGLSDGHQITAKDAPFWHELNPDEQQHLLTSAFPSVDPKYRHVIPNVYNAWVTDTYHKVPSLMFPQGLNKLMGGSGSPQDLSGPGPDSKGYTNIPVWKLGADGKPTMENQKVIHTLSDDERQQVFSGPTGWSSVPEAQQAQAKALWDQHGAALKSYRDEFSKDPSVSNYLTGTGDQPGILPLSQDLHSLADRYRDKNGNLTGEIDSQTAKAMAFKYGRLLNPGMGVRDWELQSMAHGAGLLQELGQRIDALKTGNKIPAQVLEGMMNTTDRLKDMAQYRFESSLRSWGQRLGPEAGLKLSDVVNYKPALDEFQNKPFFPTAQEASQTLPPGTHFRSADTPPGKIGVVNAQAAPPPGSATPSTPPGVGAVAPPMVTQPGFQETAPGSGWTRPSLPPIQPSPVQPPTAPVTPPRHEDFGSYRDWAKAEDAYEASQKGPAKAAYNLFSKYAPAEEQTRAAVGVGGLPKPSTSAFLGLGNPDSMDPTQLRNWVFSEMKRYGKAPPEWLLKLNNEIVRQSQLPSVRRLSVSAPGR